MISDEAHKSSSMVHVEAGCKGTIFGESHASMQQQTVASSKISLQIKCT
jgi:hypothetical protein